MPDLPSIDMPAIAPALEAAESRAAQAASLVAEREKENAYLRDELQKQAGLIAKLEETATSEKTSGGAGKGMRAPRLKPAERERFKAIDVEMAADPRKKRGLIDHIEYAQAHMDDEDAKAIEAPSRADWTMLFFARTNAAKFFEKFIPMLAKRQEESGPTINQGGLGITEDDEGLHIIRLRHELGAAVKASKKMGG